jgi:hypothetical protein
MSAEVSDEADEGREDCVLIFGNVPPLMIKPVMIAMPAIAVSV